MVVTFDLDSTLLWTRAIRDDNGNVEDTVQLGASPHTMPLLLAALDRGDEVHIVTSRLARLWREDTLAHLREWGVLDRLAGVHFTDGALKRDTLAALGAEVHHDDDPIELENLPDGCRGVLAPIHPSWLRPRT
jgi:hypothetical protein